MGWIWRTVPTSSARAKARIHNGVNSPEKRRSRVQNRSLEKMCTRPRERGEVRLIKFLIHSRAGISISKTPYYPLNSPDVITYLQGRLVESLPTRVVVEVHGVGYEVLIPLSSFEKLPSVGGEIRLLTHLAIREDAHVLYGFITSAERDLFRLLIDTVSGIGPKTALNVLSGISVTTFEAAVRSGDFKALSSIAGVGKKTAERIVVELKDKLGGFSAIPGITGGGVLKPAPGADSRLSDAAAALTALGFKPIEAMESVRAAAAMLSPGATTEQLVRASLKKP